VATDVKHPIATLSIMVIKHMTKPTNIIVKSEEIQYEEYTHTSGPMAGKTEKVRKGANIVYGIYTPQSADFLKYYQNLPNGEMLEHLKLNTNVVVYNTEPPMYRVDLARGFQDELKSEKGTK
jgi:accessory colonization factor AcfC